MKGCLGYRLKLVGNQGPNEGTLPKNVTRFSFKSLKKATKDFSTRIRMNGFSSSYKGLLEDGSIVIVKVLYTKNYSLDFISLIKIMSGIKHKNVVELIGYCIEGDHRMLVHEFVGDYSLDSFLFNNSRDSLDWPVRASICLGIARGLEYLHAGISPRVVNRDVKPGNVVLDRKFNPKIVDFEMACLIEESDYISRRIYTEKTDVYGFGVILLEVIKGSRNGSFGSCGLEISFMPPVRELQENGRVLEIVDSTLVGFPVNEVIGFIDVALSCIEECPSHRPSMFEVLLMLSGGYDFSKKVEERSRQSQLLTHDDELNDSALGDLIEL